MRTARQELTELEQRITNGDNTITADDLAHARSLARIETLIDHAPPAAFDLEEVIHDSK